MKLNERGGIDGLDENIKIYAATNERDNGISAAGYDAGDPFDDDDEEEEVVVMITSDDDDDLDGLEEADDLLGPSCTPKRRSS